MTDRELLEAAAKAAGLDLQDDLCSNQLWIRAKPADVSGFIWNPLRDDGDALRLAVKLGISITQEQKNGLVYCDVVRIPGSWPEEDHASDPYAATRRAIVRAAAEMQKDKP